MAAVLGILVLLIAIATSVVSLGCWIFTLVKLFQKNEVALGVVGIFCPIVAYIMGWVKSSELDHKTVMLIWTGAIGAGLVINFVGGAIVAAMAGGGN